MYLLETKREREFIDEFSSRFFLISVLKYYPQFTLTRPAYGQHFEF